MNQALVLIDQVIEQMNTGFVVCRHCGEQEDTATLDFAGDVKEIKQILLKAI